MIGQIAQNGTLGGSALASWTPFWGLVGGVVAIVVACFAVGRPSTQRWPMLQPLSRVPDGLRRVTGVPGWAATSIGLALYGLLVAGQGFYADVSWHIALGRDDDLLTAPHSGILLGLVMILGGAVAGTLVATFEGVDGLRVGALRVPRSLLPLWALGIGAVAGFPLDEVWHRAYGVDVTMWSPTHMLMILGATFTGVAAWLILAESGIRPEHGRWGRGAHLVCGWLTVQGLLAPMGEFTFGVPQFSLLFAPVLVCLAAGLGLVAFRIVHGRWWLLGFVIVNFAIQATGFLDFGSEDGGPVDTRFGATFLVSGLVVELVAAVLGTERRTRFALVSGLGIGTLGLAGEWAWNQGAWQPWTSAMFPEAALLGLAAAVAASLLGAALGGAIGEPGRPAAASSAPPAQVGAGRVPVPGGALVLAAVVAVAVVLIPMRRPVGTVDASVHLEPATDGTAFVEATLTPPGAADDAYWFQMSSWQGGGLVLADMEPAGPPGTFRSSEPVPVTGLWKSLLRLHRGAEMMTVPVYLPADPDIDEEEIPAQDRTMAFESERDYLLRETVDGNGWLSPLVHAGLAATCGLWAAAFVVAVRARRSSADDPGRVSGRPGGAAAAPSSGAAAAVAAGPAAPLTRG